MDQQLAPFQRRLRLILAIRGAGWGLLVGAVITLFLSLLDYGLHSQSLQAWPFTLTLPSLLGLFISAFRPLPLPLVAATVDQAAGLGAGITTALELQQKNHAFAAALQDSAFKALAATSPKDVLPAKRPPQLFNTLILLLVAGIVCYLPPIQQKDPAASLNENAFLTAAQSQKLADAATELRSQSDHEAELREIARETQKIAKDLEDEKLDLQSAFDKLGRLEEELHSLRERDEAHEKIRDALKDSDLIDELRESISGQTQSPSGEMQGELKALEEMAQGSPETEKALKRYQQAKSPLARKDAAQDLIRTLSQIKEDETQLEEDVKKSIKKLEDTLRESQRALAENAQKDKAQKAGENDGAPSELEGDPQPAESKTPKQVPSKDEDASKTEESGAKKDSENPSIDGVDEKEKPKSGDPEKDDAGGKEGDPSSPDFKDPQTPKNGDQTKSEEPKTKTPDSVGKDTAGKDPTGKEPTADEGTKEKTKEGKENAEDRTVKDKKQPSPSPDDPKNNSDGPPDKAPDQDPPEKGEENSDPSKAPEPEETKKKDEKAPKDDGDSGGLLQDLAVDMAKKVMDMGIEPPTDLLEDSDLMENEMVQDWAKSMVEKLIDSGFEVPKDFKPPKIPDSMKNKELSPEMKEWQKKIAEKLLKSGFKPPKNMKLPDGKEGQNGAQEPEQWQKDFAKKLLDSGFKPSKELLEKAKSQGRAGKGGKPQGAGGSKAAQAAGGNRSPGAAQGSTGKGKGKGVRGGGKESAASGSPFEGSFFTPDLKESKDKNGQKKWVISEQGNGSGEGSRSTRIVPGNPRKARPRRAYVKKEVKYDAISGDSRQRAKLPNGYKAYIKRYFEYKKDAKKK